MSRDDAQNNRPAKNSVEYAIIEIENDKIHGVFSRKIAAISKARMEFRNNAKAYKIVDIQVE